MSSISAGTTSTTALVSTADTTGELVIKTGASGTTALTIDTSQNAVVAGTLKVGGVATDLRPLVSDTVKTASSTSVDFTSIPSWVKRITVMFNGLSTNGTSITLVQLGVSGTAVTTGYVANAARLTVAPALNLSNLTTGFGLTGSASTADTISGLMTITNISGNVWVAAFTGANVNSTQMLLGAGNVTLSGALDMLRITTVNGTDTFDAGTINILYE